MRKIISFTLYNLSQFISYLDNLVTKYAYTPRDSTLEDFQGLTPSDNANNFEHYEKEIKKALDSKYIKNIAISGAYGAGKSSILRTFEKTYPRYKYINISLASFNVEQAKTPDEIKNFEAKIEKSIMQQIFYKVESRKLPFSKFKRIQNTSKITVLVKAVLFFLWLLAGYAIFKDFNLPNIQFMISEAYTKEYFKLIAASLFSIITIIIFYILGRSASNSILNKLTFKGAEIKVPGSSKLNEFLDELLYFFEVTPYQVVVFEDLDRHDNDSIFTKLRELNALINNAEQVKRGLPIKFIYAIKDEMFTGTERTKFFDYIIPIVPIITPANAGDVLWDALADKNKDSLFSETFIHSIAVYIEDMRMLKNISFEFMTYKSCMNVKDNKEELEKLFSLIVYKNCFPEDFAKLHRDSGLLVRLFKGKKALISDKQEKIQEKIGENEAFIRNLQNDHLKNLGELQALYISALVKNCPNCYYITLNSAPITIDQLFTGSTFETFAASGGALLNPQTVQRQSIRSPLTFTALETDVGSYSERQALLEKKEKGFEVYAQDEIEKLRREYAEVSIKPLSLLINNEFRDFLTTTLEAIQNKENLEEEEKDLIIFLLRNGYIAEDYHSYISFFYPSSLTQQEHEFIKNVQNQIASDETTLLENCKKVLGRLSILGLQNKSSLNFYLLNYVLSLKTDEKVEAYLSCVCDGSQASVSFLAKYIIWGESDTGKLLDVLFERWPNAWAPLTAELGGGGQYKTYIFELMVKHVSVKNIVAAVESDKGNSLFVFISSYFTVISKVYTEERERTEKVIQALDIKFEYLEELDKHLEFSSFIYNGSFYEISYHNISTLLEAYAPEVCQNKLCDAPLTILLASECEPIKKYVLDNLDVYINKVLLTQTSDPQESEDTVLMLINSQEISEKLKEQALVKVGKPISNIVDVEDKEFWDRLLDINAVESSWKNVYAYYLNSYSDEEEGLNENLINFLNSENNYNKLSLKKVSKKDFDDENVGLSLLQSIYLCNDLNDEAYKSLLESTNIRWSKLSFEGLSEEKVKLLISTKSLSFTQENLIYLENHYESLCIEFIGQNIEEYLSDPSVYDLDSGELVVLYQMEGIEGVNKVKLTALIEEADFSASEELIELVANCLLHVDDVSDVNSVILASLIILHQNVKEKKVLLSKLMSLISKESVKECLEAIDKRYAGIFKYKKPKVENTHENAVLLSALQRKGMISQYNTEGDKFRIQPKRNPLV